MHNLLTSLITVTATPTYQGESTGFDDVYSIWSYNVVIKNYSSSSIRILSRYWKIIDSHGLIQEITGKGVIGQKPIIHPGSIFEYTSFTNLRASSGVMIGKYYAVEVQSGKKIEISIPAFSLDNPEEKTLLN